MSEAIRQAVEASDKTQAELSRETGVAESVISRLRHGERGIMAGTAAKLAEALGLEIIIRPKGHKRGR